MQVPTVEKLTNTETISAMQARKEFGAIMNRAVYQGRSVIVERAGTPAIVILPVERYQQYMEREAIARQTFFDMTEELRERFSELSETEIERLVDETVAEVRAERRTSLDRKPA